MIEWQFKLRILKRTISRKRDRSGPERTGSTWNAQEVISDQRTPPISGPATLENHKNCSSKIERRGKYLAMPQVAPIKPPYFPRLLKTIRSLSTKGWRTNSSNETISLTVITVNYFESVKGRRKRWERCASHSWYHPRRFLGLPDTQLARSYFERLRTMLSQSTRRLELLMRHLKLRRARTRKITMEL